MAIRDLSGAGRVTTSGRLWLRLWSWAWLASWGGLAALGLLLGARTWSSSTVLGVGVLAGSVAVLCTFLRNGRQPAGSLHETQIAQIVSVAARRALVAGAAAVALGLLVRVLGSLVWPMLLLGAVTSPWGVRWALGRERAHGERGSLAIKPRGASPSSTVR